MYESSYTMYNFVTIYRPKLLYNIPGTFSDVMEDMCSETITMSPSSEAGTVILTSNSKYKYNLICNLFITAPPGRFVMISFPKVDLEPGPSATTCQTAGDNVKIYNSFDYNDYLNQIAGK